MIFASFACKDAEGAMLAHTLRLSTTVLKKGRRLTREDIAALQADGIDVVNAVKLEADDHDENEAARRVASALAGPGLTIGKPLAGRCNLYAKTAGLVQVAAESVDALNLLGGEVTLSTLAQHSDAMSGQAVATVKVIPFAVSGALLDRCLDVLSSDKPAVRLLPFRPLRVGLVLTESTAMKASVLASTRAVTEQRLEQVGSTLDYVDQCGHSEDEITVALKKVYATDCELVLVSGATVTIDRADVVPRAIEREGGEIIHFGMPVEPGNMLLLAHFNGRYVINLPGCSRSPKLNGLDWVLQRIAAGLDVSASDIQLMGVGGLIKDLPHVDRMKRKRRESTEAKFPSRIAAIILAAGSSKRMGEQNKLLLQVGEVSLVQQAVRTAVDSDAEEVIVVTGHDPERVTASIETNGLRIVHNPGYANGMASSLAAGLSGVSAEMDGAIILLADMPGIAVDHVNEIIAEFNPLMERDIVVPFKDGRRGNPVLWSRQYFRAIEALRGDTGARALLEEHSGNVWDVAIDDDSIFVDIDTREDFLRFSSNADPATEEGSRE